jgi:hypothetical protein
MTFMVPTAALLLLSWAAADATWGMIPREPPVSIVAGR